MNNKMSHTHEKALRVSSKNTGSEFETLMYNSKTVSLHIKKLTVPGNLTAINETGFLILDCALIKVFEIENFLRDSVFSSKSFINLLTFCMYPLVPNRRPPTNQFSNFFPPRTSLFQPPGY